MHILRPLTLLAFLCLPGMEGCSQSPGKRKLIGPCEGCEAVFEYGNKPLSSTLTLPGYTSEEPKLVITGTVYKKNGKIPAEGVVLYFHHTNREGIYPKRGDETGWGKRHGYIRGWLKTGKDGKYTLRTFRPGAYPDGNNPEHIHITVLEPDGKYYWIDSFLFADDPLLSEERKQRKTPRGGEGFLLHPEKRDGMLYAERDIVLGRNVEGYEN